MSDVVSGHTPIAILGGPLLQGSHHKQHARRGSGLVPN